MVLEKDILRIEISKSNLGKSIKLAVFCCKNCAKEVKMSKSKLKTATGYCYSCKSIARIKQKQIEGLKYCPSCESNLDIEKFSNKNRTIGNKSNCNRCNNLKKHYNITGKEFDLLLKSQNYCCAICNKHIAKNLSVDHNHITGKIRGLLCQKCNQALGMLEDNVDFFENAIKYLIRNQ